MGNDFQDAVGKLTWEFMVEELPVETTDPRPTGDNSNIYVAMTVMSVSAAALSVVLALKKKKEQEQ